jgi:acetylornithine deacetylase/succinyl-diaminopimelate desuccinylase-like protein
LDVVTTSTPPSAPTPATSADDVTSEPTDAAALRPVVAAGFGRVRADLDTLVRIPGVSSPTFDQAQVARSAELVAALLREVLPEVQVLTVTRTDGLVSRPAVIARRPARDGAPTVLLYAHHDVQPPGEDWRTDPFEPVELDGRFFGRGSADDKAGIVAHLGALRALPADAPVGITVFVEGEEEVGSPTFVDFLQAHRELLTADLVVLADAVNWKVGVPAFTTSLRGLVDCVVEVAVLEHAIHSGMYGGPVLDALTALVRLLATLHDEAGDVAVAGLVTAPEPTVDYDEDDLRTDASVLPGVGLIGTGSLTARLWTKPALTVIGIDAPSVALSSNTILPTARAKVSLRIAPGQDPAAAFDALRDHLLGNAPFGARVTVTEGDLGRPWAGAADSPLAEVARAAYRDAWGTAPVDAGLGGSIPLVADFLEVFPGTTVLVTGVEDPDSRAHSANESVHLGELEKAVLAETLLLSRLR